MVPTWLHLGNYYNGASHNFAHSARLDEMRLYSRALASNEVAQLALVTGLEGDVGPRNTPSGDGVLDAVDVTQILRFFEGKDANDLVAGFVRADCAPRNTKGDGVLNTVDLTQLLRYIEGKDPQVSAGGPTDPGVQPRQRRQGARSNTILSNSSPQISP